MDRQNLYVALLNAVLGVAISLMLNGNLLIYALAFIAILTILIIERRRIYEKIFRQKIWFAVAGYAALGVVMIVAYTMINRTGRDKVEIIQMTRDFMKHIKPDEYDKAYDLISDTSKKTYSKENFLKDNQRVAAKIEDFRIDGVEFNEFDKQKAVVKVSSPFMIYGQSSMSFECVEQENGWRLVFTPSIVQSKGMQASQSGGGSRSTSRRRSSGGSGSLGSVFRSMF